MCTFRLKNHPIVEDNHKEELLFYFDGKPLTALRGEPISTALFANGIRIFGKHHSDNASQGIFCANGQCSQCLVLANGEAVKACITEIKPNMKVNSILGYPALSPDDSPVVVNSDPKEFHTQVLIMGAGPAGLSAAIELGKENINVIICDDKLEAGGKLPLQTHNFFGSLKECKAGMRGMNIGKSLTEEALSFNSVKLWLNSPIIGVFGDRKVGVLKNGKYVLVKPDRFLVTAGAREKAISFPGCDLPGIYGAGAFQTLVNRDLVKASKKLFILGGGNVGLITAYHALQAGIDVLGLIEAQSECGGYKVHLDKIKRLGVPVWTNHTILSAEGHENLEKIIITEIDKNFHPIPGTKGEFYVDTLLIAAGLNPVNEMIPKAIEANIPTYSAGDACVIAEASAAIFSGKIVGKKILNDIGIKSEIPLKWFKMEELLRQKHCKTHGLKNLIEGENKVYPVIRCTQEIPCNPCAEVCPHNSILMDKDNILSLPIFKGKCTGCFKCISICPGLAITIVDKRVDPSGKKALVTIPWEMPDGIIKEGDSVQTTGYEGETISIGIIKEIREKKWQDKRKLVSIETDLKNATHIAGIRIRTPEDKKEPKEKICSSGDEIICRCERITKQTIIERIEKGCRDFNALKAELRVGMGPCGGKTCTSLIWKIFNEHKIDPSTIKPHVYRPFELEIPFKAFLEDSHGEEK